MEVNWAGTHTYRAERLHRPATVEAARAIVAGAPQVRVLGSRHAFTDIADAAELVSLDGLPADIRVDGGTVSCGGAVRYGELAPARRARGRARRSAPRRRS